MPRPTKFRVVEGMPQCTYFKPQGIPIRAIGHVVLEVGEYEAVRLKDLDEIEQTEAARRMGIHQSTFQRTLKSARHKIADALVSGKAIRIEGGAFKMPGRNGTGPAGASPAGPGGRGAARGAGMGRRAGMAGGHGMGSGFAMGPGGKCRCPKCGHEAKHRLGVPCYSQKCPKCGAALTRA